MASPTNPDSPENGPFAVVARAYVANARPALTLVSPSPELGGAAPGEPNAGPAPEAPAAYLACAGLTNEIELVLDANASPEENGSRLRHALSGLGLEEPTLAGGAGEVRLTCGDFMIDGGVTLTSGQRVVGASPVDGTTLVLNGALLFSVRPHARNVQLTSVRIEHPGDGSGIGVDLRGADGVTLVDVHFDGMSTGGRCRRGRRRTALLVIEGCVFSNCSAGVKSSGSGQVVELVRVVGCAFEVGRGDEGGVGIRLNGEGVSVMGCRFSGGETAAGVVATWRAIDVSGPGSAVRYNVFDAAPPHIVAVPTSSGEGGALVEHNVHLREGNGVLIQRGLDAGVHRGAGRARVDCGEAHHNLLLNGSFEWWEPRDLSKSVVMHPVGWQTTGRVAIARLRGGAHRSVAGLEVGLPPRAIPPECPPPAAGQEGDPPREAPTRLVGDPQIRHGLTAVRVTAGRGEVKIAAESIRVDRGGPFTFSCWVRVDEDNQASAPHVRLWARADENEVVSPPYALMPSHAPTWQRLACTLIAPADARTVEVAIEIGAPNNVGSVALELDGAAVARGYLALEPDPRLLTDAGGEILGPIRFVGAGADLKVHLQLIAPPGGQDDAVETIAIPFNCQWTGTEFSADGDVHLTFRRVLRGARFDLRPLRAGSFGRQPNHVDLTRGELLEVTARRTAGPIVNATFEFRRARHEPPRGRVGPLDG